MSRFIISGFADEIADDLQSQIATLKKLGIGFMEMRNVNGKQLVEHDLNEVKEIKSILDDNGIKLSAVGSPIGKIGINDNFMPHFDKFKHTVEIAQLMQTKYIRMFSFFIPNGHDADQYEEEVLKRWTMFADHVKGTDIVLLHENEKDIYGDVPTRCKNLLDKLDSNHVQGIFDPANFVQCKVNTLEAFDMLKDKTVYMHIKDAIFETGKVVPSGEGDGHVAEILKMLVDRGFDGFLSLEPHLETGDIAVGGAEKFEIAYNALMSIIKTLDVEVL